MDFLEKLSISDQAKSAIKERSELEQVTMRLKEWHDQVDSKLDSLTRRCEELYHEIDRLNIRLDKLAGK